MTLKDAEAYAETLKEANPNSEIFIWFFDNLRSIPVNSISGMKLDWEILKTIKSSIFVGLERFK